MLKTMVLIYQYPRCVTGSTSKQIFFFLVGLNVGAAEGMAVFWHVGGGSKIKSAVTVCSLDRSEIKSTGAGLQRWLGFVLAWKEPAGQGYRGFCPEFLSAGLIFVIISLQLVGGQPFKVFIGCLYRNLNYGVFFWVYLNVKFVRTVRRTKLFHKYDKKRKSVLNFTRYIHLEEKL